jgi:predicted component of type VI protein secretion system
LTDFADRSLSSPSDRAYICERLEKTIERHEPRLRKVKAMLEVRDDNSVNRLKFSITALLVVSTTEEPVNLDVTERLLVATEAGRNLYSSLGWQLVAPWATAVLPAMRCRSSS